MGVEFVNASSLMNASSLTERCLMNASSLNEIMQVFALLVRICFYRSESRDLENGKNILHDYVRPDRERGVGVSSPEGEIYGIGLI